jgi:hypothetical protein
MVGTRIKGPKRVCRAAFTGEDGATATIVVIAFATFMFGLAAVAIDLSAG